MNRLAEVGELLPPLPVPEGGLLPLAGAVAGEFIGDIPAHPLIMNKRLIVQRQLSKNLARAWCIWF